MPVSKEELDESLGKLGTELRGEMADSLGKFRTELRGEMATLGTELRGEMAELRSELRGEMAELKLHTERTVAVGIASLRSDMEAMEQRVRDDLGQQLRDTVQNELARWARSIAEEMRSVVRAFDDKYRHLPGEVSTLRRDLDQHVTASALHVRRRKSR